MAKYILLMNWTEQGFKAIQGSGDRFEAAKELAQKCGCTLEATYMTFGQYDQVTIMEAPNDEAIALFDLRIAALGNVRLVTMRAFDVEEYRRITSSV
jgi:uncharacterized protein with GYD domain